MERILVIEDDLAVQRALRRSFELAGFDVTTAADGAVAMETFRATLPDIVGSAASGLCPDPPTPWESVVPSASPLRLRPWVIGSSVRAGSWCDPRHCTRRTYYEIRSAMGWLRQNSSSRFPTTNCWPKSTLSGCH